MNQKKQNPAGGRGKTREAEQATPLYPASSPAVNRICGFCEYFRQAYRSFCRFSGENVPPGWTCDFWAPREAAI
jgi:hypothetical protein